MRLRGTWCWWRMWPTLKDFPQRPCQWCWNLSWGFEWVRISNPSRLLHLMSYFRCNNSRCSKVKEWTQYPPVVSDCCSWLCMDLFCYMPTGTQGILQFITCANKCHSRKSKINKVTKWTCQIESISVNDQNTSAIWYWIPFNGKIAGAKMSLLL